MTFTICTRECPPDCLKEKLEMARRIEELEKLLPDEGAYLIHIDDADRSTEYFIDAGAKEAALRRFEQVSISWSANLFVKIKSNTICGRRVPDAFKVAHPSQPTADTGLSLPIGEQIK